MSVVDDATLVGLWGSFNFDDEGTPAQRIVLFDGGTCADYLTDRMRAKELGLPRWGNAWRESYAHLSDPRMTNTLIEPGADDPEPIVASVESGLCCGALGGGRVDPPRATSFSASRSPTSSGTASAPGRCAGRTSSATALRPRNPPSPTGATPPENVVASGDDGF